jgi:predicted alpha/beta-hydrolase family hydrolase
LMLHQPTEKSIGSLLLTHGAGSNAEAPLLIACAKAFCDAGFLVLRYHLPFRQKRPSGPPHPGDAKADQAGIEEALASLRAQAQGPVIAGGHSYGGRQASVLAAAQPGICGCTAPALLPFAPAEKAAADAHRSLAGPANAVILLPWDKRPLRNYRRNANCLTSDTSLNRTRREAERRARFGSRSLRYSRAAHRAICYYPTPSL